MNNPFSVGDKVLFSGFTVKSLICTVYAVGHTFCIITFDSNPDTKYSVQYSQLTKLTTPIR